MMKRGTRARLERAVALSSPGIWRRLECETFVTVSQPGEAYVEV